MTRTIAIRVPSETADKLMGQNLREIMVKVADGIAVDVKEVPPEIMDDLRVMVELTGGTFGSFMIDLHKKIDEGAIVLEHGKIKADFYVGELKEPIQEFLNACKMRGKSPKLELALAESRL